MNREAVAAALVADEKRLEKVIGDKNHELELCSKLEDSIYAISQQSESLPNLPPLRGCTRAGAASARTVTDARTSRENASCRAHHHA